MFQQLGNFSPPNPLMTPMMNISSTRELKKIKKNKLVHIELLELEMIIINVSVLS